MGDTPRNTTRQREAGAASRAETRRQLIAAARELFSEQGYSATTVTKIARLAGVSLQTLYLACGSKRELLQVVLSEALSGTPSGIGGPLPAGAQLLKAQGGACREGRSSPAAHGFGGRGRTSREMGLQMEFALQRL